MKTRLLQPHRKGCRALGYVADGTWASPWCLTGTTSWRDRIGRLAKHGHNEWLEARCNTLDCPGRLIVRSEDVCAALPAEG